MKRFVLLLVLFFFSCREYAPKPKAYPRIEFPEKSYVWYDDPVCPFRFKYPKYALITYDTLFFDTAPEDPCWLNITIPQFGATIHLTYKSLEKHSIDEVLQQTHFMAYKHTIKADYIKERSIEDTMRDLYALFYDIGGNAASNIQFYVTDAEKNFVRGAFYVKAPPNVDSLAPLVKFVKQDLDTLIATFQWKERTLDDELMQRKRIIIRKKRISL